MATTQRIQQGVRALIAFMHGVDYDLAGHYLNEAQMRLFKRMKRSEQLHHGPARCDAMRGMPFSHESLLQGAFPPWARAQARVSRDDWNPLRAL